MKLKLCLSFVIYFVSTTFAQNDTSPPAESTSANDKYCPDIEKIKPCVCTIDLHNSSSPGVHLECNSLLSTRALMDVMEVDFPGGGNLYALDIQNSTFSRIAKDSFAGKTFMKINISQHAARLIIAEDAFDGMENHLEMLTIQNTSLGTPDQFFKSLPDLKRLNYLELTGNDIGPLDTIVCPPGLKTMVIKGNKLDRLTRANFRKCTQLHELRIENGQIKTVGADTFLDLVNIRKLLLSKNGFTALRQYSFRLNAPFLQTLSLDHNDLFQLEDKWFAGDVNSNAVFEMHNNNLTMLPRGAIEPVLIEIRAGYLTAYANPISCGCEIAWLVRDRALRKLVRKEDAEEDSGIRCHRTNYDHWVDRTNWFGNALSSIQGNLVNLGWIRDNPLLWPVVEGLTGRYLSNLRASDFNDCPW